MKKKGILNAIAAAHSQQMLFVLFKQKHGRQILAHILNLQDLLLQLRDKMRVRVLNKLKLDAGDDFAVPVGHFTVQLTLCAKFQRARQRLKDTAHGRYDPHRHRR